MVLICPFLTVTVTLVEGLLQFSALPMVETGALALSALNFKPGIRWDFKEFHRLSKTRICRRSRSSSHVFFSQTHELETETPNKTVPLAFSHERCTPIGNGHGETANNPWEGTMDLQDFKEEWRRKKIGWLCKHLVGHDQIPMLGMLNKQRHWIQLNDVKFLVDHFLRLRENVVSYRIYKWMTEQKWFSFDFSLATRLADYLAKDLKVSKCRDLFDDIIKRHHVPSEPTFILLIMAYIEVSEQGYVNEAFTIYNQMIHLGGYRPAPSLQSKLFRSLLRERGGVAKHYLQQAETIFQDMQTAGHVIKEDIYEGLIWLHSYQDSINSERIKDLIHEMKQKGYNESVDLFVSMLRVCAAHGDLDEAERIWMKMLDRGLVLCSQAYIYRMVVYAKASQPMKSLQIFRELKESGIPITVIAYHKIIQILAIFQEIEHVEILLKEHEDSVFKSMQPSYADVMKMYMSLSMFDKVEATFSRCRLHCQPNREIYDMYVESLIKSGKLQEAETTFEDMKKTNGRIKGSTYNNLLEAFLRADEKVKAKMLYCEMVGKRYEVQPQIIEQLKSLSQLDPLVHSKHHVFDVKLDAKQRDILIALLLAGAKLAAHENMKAYALHFEFNEKHKHKPILQKHLFEAFFEWLDPVDQLRQRGATDADEMPCHFNTVYHSTFCFYADQFRPGGRITVPQLLHRWLSPRVLAYWYMYSGWRNDNDCNSGDIIIVVKNYDLGDIQLLGNALRQNSISCQIKKQKGGKLFQIRFQAKDALLLWNLIKPHVVPELQEALHPQPQSQHEPGSM